MDQKVPAPPPGDAAPLKTAPSKIPKKLSPRKMYLWKILQPPPPYPTLISGEFIPRLMINSY